MNAVSPCTQTPSPAGPPLAEHSWNTGYENLLMWSTEAESGRGGGEWRGMGNSAGSCPPTFSYQYWWKALVAAKCLEIVSLIF